MTAAEIDAYLAGLDATPRAVLAQLRADLRELLPDAEEGLSYAAPVVRVRGKPVAGFSASARHLSYLPHSGTVLASLDPTVLEGYAWSKGALQFPTDQPLDRTLVATLVNVRLAEIAGK